MRSRLGVAAAALAALLGCTAVTPGDRAAPPPADGAAAAGDPGAPALALVGGTIVDVADGGDSTADVADSVVLVRGGEIVAAGPRSTVVIPPDARVVPIDGAYVVPGLHDVFAGLNSQAQANAYLYQGVTSIVGSDEPGGRRGPLLETASPSPRVHRLGFVNGWKEETAGWRPATADEVVQQVEAEVARGAKVLLLHYRLDLEEVTRAIAWARERGLPTIGELGDTTYTQGIAAGFDAFVHSSRYSLELAPPDLRAAVAAEPFGPVARGEYTQFLAAVDADGPEVATWARRLGESGVALIPTLSLTHYDLPEAENPWTHPVAAILDPSGIHEPVDRQTGKPARPNELRVARNRNLRRIEERYRRAGARYLAGSGTSAFSTLPGIALHLELRLLAEIGLTPRQALAAATSNVAEVFGWSRTGRVAAGHDADLVVVDADPTLDVRNLEKIRLVLLRGEVVDRAALLKGSAP